MAGFFLSWLFDVLFLVDLNGGEEVKVGGGDGKSLEFGREGVGEFGGDEKVEGAAGKDGEQEFSFMVSTLEGEVRLSTSSSTNKFPCSFCFTFCWECIPLIFAFILFYLCQNLE